MATDHNFRIKNGLEVGGILIVNSSGALQVSPSTVSSNITLNDNVQLQFGTDTDAQFYHDGSDLRLNNSTGNFNIQTNDFHITDVNNTTLRFKVDHDGATSIRYNGVEKLSTTTTGIKVTSTDGNVTIGALNTSGLHIYTDRDRFYFNKQISLLTNTITSYDDDFLLKRVGSTKLTLTSGGAEVTGDLDVSGDLNITGDINSVSVTDLDVVDKTITLGVGGTASGNHGGGIIINGANAEFKWDNANTNMTLNKDLKFTASQKLRFGNNYLYNSGNNNSLHIHAVSSVIPASTTIGDNASLGASTYRWNGFYSGDGDFSGAITVASHSYLQGNVYVGNSTAGNALFKRPSANYIWADQSAGYFAIGTNGRSISAANANLLLDSDQTSTFNSRLDVIGSLVVTLTGSFGGEVDAASFVADVNSSTINTGHPSMRRGSAGEMFLDAPGDIIMHIDSNNNNTDRGFRVRKDTAGSADLFSVDESGHIRLSGQTNYIYMQSNQYFTHKNVYGYIQIGPGNSAHAHINTDKSNFYFNKEITVDSGIIGSYNEDLILRRARNSTTGQLTLTGNGELIGSSVSNADIDSSSVILGGFTACTAYEAHGGHLYIPGVSPNNLAGANATHTVTITKNGSAYTPGNINEMFSASGGNTSFAHAAGTTDTIIITCLGGQLSYQSHFGVQFGHETFRAKSVKIEVSTNSGSSWTVIYDVDNFPNSTVHHGYSPGGTSINGIRYTFTDFNNTGMRINQLFAYDYSELGLYFPEKNKDSTIRADYTWYDNHKAKFGDSGDLSIYHSSTHSFITHSGTGDLKILGDNVEIGSTGSVNNFKGIAGGSSIVYYNGNTRLETVSAGIDITGRILATTTIQAGTAVMKTSGSYAAFGSNSSSRGVALSRDANVASYPDLVISSSGNVAIGQADGSDGDLTLNTPRLHVRGVDQSSAYGLVARFQAGNDADNTGAAILVNHSNDRGLLIEAGRQVGDRAISHFGLLSSGATKTRIITMYSNSSTDHRVGIGTESPNSLLNISKELTGDASQLEINNGAGAAIKIGITGNGSNESAHIKTHSGEDLEFHIGQAANSTTPRVIFKNTGNVGIGTESPDSRLNVVHSSNATNGIIVENATAGTSARSVIRLLSDAAQFDMYATSSTYSGVASWSDSGVLSTSSNASGGLVLNAQAGGIKFQDATTEIMRISDGGDVGIGTDNPSTKLNVHGGAIQLTNGTGGSYIKAVHTTNSSNAGFYMASGSSNWYTLVDTSGNYQIYDGDAAKIRIKIDGTGKTGIGPFPTSHANANNLDSTAAEAMLHVFDTGGGNTQKPLLILENYIGDHSTTPTKVGIDIRNQDSNNLLNQLSLLSVTVNDTDYGVNDEAAVHFIIAQTRAGTLNERAMFHADGHMSIGSTLFNPYTHVNTGSYFKPNTSVSTTRLVSIGGGVGGGDISLASSTTTDDGHIGGLYFTSTPGAADAHKQLAGIDCIYDLHSTNSAVSGGHLRFFTKPTGAGTNSQRMWISQNGNIYMRNQSGSDVVAFDAQNSRFNCDWFGGYQYPTTSFLDFDNDSPGGGGTNGVHLSAVASMDFTIDSNNNGSSDAFTWLCDNASPASGTQLMQLTDDGDLTVTGALAATTKSFDIEHPTKEGKRLHHGVLEGPEHAVYIRGRSSNAIIELPEYWIGLVHEYTITVQLTAMGKSSELYVKDIVNNTIHVEADCEYFYFIQGERKDVERFEVEYDS